MNLVFLRIVFGAVFLYLIAEVVENAADSPEGGDLTNAWLLALSLVMALANAAVWAPYLGARLSAPLTMMLTEGSHVERKSRLLGLARRLHDRGHRRLTGLVCLFEGLEQHGQPTVCLIGLKSARPGSWMERHFAMRVFRFANAGNCIEAYRILRKHGMDPRPHRSPEINAILQAIERKANPDPQPIALETAIQLPQLKRDSRIRLFERPTHEAPTEEGSNRRGEAAESGGEGGTFGQG
jgi:hypothetical protein